MQKVGSCVLQEAIDRVRRMEALFDLLQQTDAREDPCFQRQLQILVQYYESGQWLRDYELDEKGYLPGDLKRGVLSEDAVYNFLTELDE